MLKLKNQLIVIFMTVFFVIAVLIAQNVIFNKIYNVSDFNDIENVVKNKEFLIKNIYFDGKHFSNSITQNIDLNSTIHKQNDINEYSIFLKKLFTSEHTLSNITLLDNEFNTVFKEFKFNKKIDLEEIQIKKFINSNKNETLSVFYLKKEKGEIQVPFIPKVSYLKKIFDNNDKLSGILVLEFDLNFRLKNLYDNSKYDFTLLDNYGNSYYHFDYLKSWSKYIKRDSVLDDAHKVNLSSILRNRVFKSDTLESYHLNLEIQDGLILIASLKDDYISEVENIYFKREISFFIFFVIASVIVLTVVLIILNNSSKSLSKIQELTKELKEFKKFSNNAQNIAQVGLWKVDLYNNLIWNDWMYNLLEIDNDKIKISYDSFIAYIHPDDKEKFDTEYRYSKNKKNENYLTYRIITANGVVKWVEQRWKHYYTKNDQFAYTLGSLVDISKKRNMENLLKLENDNLSHKIGIMPFGIVIIDLEKKVKFVNKTFQELVGYKEKEIFRKETFDMFLDEDSEIFSLLVVDIKEKELIKNQEIRLVKNNGEVITFQISMVLDNNSKEILLVLSDITSNIKEHDKNLMNQSRLADLGEMLIDLTYQWRQPLSIISTSASFLKLEHEINAQQREETIDVLRSIISSSNKLSNTIDDFRYYVEDSKEETSFSVNNSIQKVLILLENQIYENNIELITDFDEDVEIKNVENSFMQVLVNVIKNSIEALENYPQQKKVIKISTSILKDKLQVNITDNAHGIDDNIMPKIFDEFFTTKSNKNSTGLGLYLTKKIVNSKLKGSILAKNVEFKFNESDYKGVTFMISISLLNKELNNE